MIRLVLAAILFLSSTALAQERVEDPADRLLSIDEVNADVDLLEEAYGRIHPGLTRYASAEDIAASWNSIRTQAQENGGLTLGDFYLAVQRALTVMRCDHTKAEISKDMRDYRKETPFYLPFKWQVVEGRGFVTGVPDKSPVALKDELVSIDGRLLADVIAEVEPFIPVDGYTTWARAGGVAQSLEFMGGAVDHFGALMWDVSPQATLAVRRHETGEEETITVDRMAWDDYHNIKEPDEPAANFKDSVMYRAIGDDAAYLRVDTFVNYRNPVKPQKIFDPIFKKLKQEKRKTLILDLRRNGGGSDDAQNELMRNLITRKMRLIRDARVMTIDHSGLEDYLSTWEERAINPPAIAFRKNSDGTYSLKPFFDSVLKAKKPARYAFAGDIIVLTSRDNSSGSTNMIAVLKSLGRATLVGEKTGGSPNGTTAGVILTLALPNSDISTRIPQFRYFNNVDGFKDGYGAEPDIAAPLTADAFLADRDPAMEAAMALIEGR